MPTAGSRGSLSRSRPPLSLRSRKVAHRPVLGSGTMAVLVLLTGCARTPRAVDPGTCPATCAPTPPPVPSAPGLTGVAAHSGPALDVTPLTGLRDGQQVRVRALGFRGSHKVFFSECANAAAANTLGCGDQLAAQVFAVTDDGGQATTWLTIHNVGYMKPYDTGGSVQCTDQCVLVATTNLAGIGIGTARLSFSR